MRKKHRFRKMLSSIIGVDIHHPDNSKVLDSKKDIEQNVQKILKIIGEESNMDNSVNSFDKSELTFLVTDFHKSYQELHEHYYQLIEKLHRGDEGGPSDSSSSGSSDSDSDNKKKSRKVKEDKAQVIPLQDYQNLQEQVECAERKNRQLQCEIESTCSKLAELENLAAKLRERDSVIGTLENKLLMMGGSIEALQSENGVLKQKAEALLKEETDMKERIAIFNEENEALRLENRETSDKLSQAEKCVKELSLLKDHMSDEMLRLKLENTNLKEEVEERDVIVASMKQKLNDTIKEKEALKLATEESSSKTALLLSEVENLELLLKAADKKGDDLTQRLTTIEEENRSLQSEILRLSSNIKEAGSTINNLTADSELLKYEKSELLNSNNDLNEQVKAKEDEVHALASQLEKAQMAKDEVEMLSAEIQTRKNECSRLLANCVDLNLTLESRDAEVSNLKQIIEATQGENKSLTEESLQLASKVQQVELERDGLKGENEQLMVDISLLESEINKMNELNKELGAMAEEKDRLISENSRFMSELEQADVSVKELEKELEQLKNENSVLQLNKVKLQEAEKLINDCKAEIEQLRNGKALSQTKLDDARFELEVANCQITDLNKEVAVLREGNNTAATELQLALAHEQKLESELEQLREEVSMLQQTNAGLRNENSDMEKRLEVMGVEVLTLQQKLEEIQRESDSKIQAMTICADDLQKELDLLSIQKSKVEEERNIISDRCLGNLVLMKNLEEEIKSKIVYQETRLSDLRGSFNEFLSNFKQFKHKFAILENLSIDQNKDMMKLANSCKELEENLVLSEDEKMNALKEIARMHGQVQTLEVQVRLSNQKVKITETESRDKEEKYEKLVEVSQKRDQELEEKMQKLYGELGSLQAQLMQMKEDAKLGTSALGNRIRELESIFSQKSTHFIGRLVECSGILKILEEMAKNQLYEKEELKNEKHELAVRLEKKEGAISSLKDEASYRGAKLAEKERDLEKLMRTVFESEKKIEELEKRVKEKEEELVAKNEEKREAIRQLCLLIEYHRENCTNLLRHVSPTIRSRSS